MRPLWMVLALALMLAGSTAALQPSKPLSLPLDEYRLSPAEAGRVARAHRRLLAQCLEPFGLSVPERGSAPDDAAVTVGLNERRYGVTNARDASTFGYRLPPRNAPVPRAEPDPRLMPVLAGTGERVIGGRTVPEGGCYAEARRRLHTQAPPARDMLLAQRLDMEGHGLSKADGRVAAAWARWSECMRAKGYRYPDPLRAAGDPAFRGPVSGREIATALADIECKDRTRLVAHWSAVEARWQHAMIARHRAGLEAIRRAHAGQLAVAHQLGV